MNPQNTNETLYFALFNIHPSQQPPFILTLGTSGNDIQLENCQHIPEGIEKLKSNMGNYNISPNFTLIYPIYMDAMNTENEGTMHYIAGLILDESLKYNWKFDRIGGLTNRTEDDFRK